MLLNYLCFCVFNSLFANDNVGFIFCDDLFCYVDYLILFSVYFDK